MKKWKKALMMCVVAMLIISLSIIAYAKFAVPTFPSNLPELNPHELDFDVPQTLSNNESNINDESDISVPMAKDALPISTKEEVFDRMLNSIDYFNTAQICFDLLMSPVEEPITCIIETNLVTGESYEATVPLIAGAASIDGALAEVETYSDGDNITNYYNKKPANKKSSPLSQKYERKRMEKVNTANRPPPKSGSQEEKIISVSPSQTRPRVPSL